MELCSFFFNLLLLAACESVFEEVIVGCNDIIRLMSESKGIVSKTCLQGDLFLSQNNRGRRAEQDVWVFGFVTTKYTPCRGYFQVVKRRDAATLHPIIENVFVWALKCTHDWGAYSNLDQRLHIVATHRVVKKDMQSYLDDRMWRKWRGGPCQHIMRNV